MVPFQPRLHASKPLKEKCPVEEHFRISKDMKEKQAKGVYRMVLSSIITLL